MSHSPTFQNTQECNQGRVSLPSRPLRDTERERAHPPVQQFKLILNTAGIINQIIMRRKWQTQVYIENYADSATNLLAQGRRASLNCIVSFPVKTESVSCPPTPRAPQTSFTFQGKWRGSWFVVGTKKFCHFVRTYFLNCKDGSACAGVLSVKSFFGKI